MPRPRIHESNAAKQKAYRDRKRGIVTPENIFPQITPSCGIMNSQEDVLMAPAATAKQALDFNGWTETDVLLVKIVHKFDVRAFADTLDDAVRELQLAGPKSRRPPYVTIDLVEVDGRHEIERHRRQNPLPEMIRVRMLPFQWADLSESQKADVEAWALEQNMPDPKDGPRVLANTDDITMNIRRNLDRGYGETKIRTLFAYVPADQFKFAWRSAFESWKQSHIARVEKLRKDEDLKPSEAAGHLPPSLRKGYLAIRKANGGGSTPVPTKAGARAILQSQKMLEKAVAAMERYNTSLLNDYIAGKAGHSAVITRHVLTTHQATITRLQGKFNKGKTRIEAAIAQREQQGRGPNRY